MLRFENTSDNSFMCLSVSVSLFTLSLIIKFYNKLKNSKTQITQLNPIKNEKIIESKSIKESEKDSYDIKLKG
jgi:hypothetical protein